MVSKSSRRRDKKKGEEIILLPRGSSLQQTGNAISHSTCNWAGRKNLLRARFPLLAFTEGCHIVLKVNSLLTVAI